MIHCSNYMLSIKMSNTAHRSFQNYGSITLLIFRVRVIIFIFYALI